MTASALSMQQSYDLCLTFRNKFISEEKAQIKPISIDKLKVLSPKQRKLCYTAIDNIEKARLSDFELKSKAPIKASQRLSQDEDSVQNALHREIQAIQSTINGDKIRNKTLPNKKVGFIRKTIQAIARFVYGIFRTIRNTVTRKITSKMLHDKVIHHCENSLKADLKIKENENTLMILEKASKEKCNEMDEILKKEHSEILDKSFGPLFNAASKGENLSQPIGALNKSLENTMSAITSVYKDKNKPPQKLDIQQISNYGFNSLNRFKKENIDETSLLKHKYFSDKVETESEIIFDK